ncbi:calcium-binding protein [Marinobacterium sp. YM272]|uniref:calcium-binding protein n=1 Tax=Marinobacterium sp. YM272 TaxID=3421654 RepID=UPI003D7F807F
MAITDKSQYINDVKDAAEQFTNQILSGSNISTSIAGLYATIDNSDATTLDKAIAIAQVVAVLSDAIPANEYIKKYVSFTGTSANYSALANDFYKLLVQYTDDDNGNTLGPDTVASFIGNATGIVADSMKVVPPVALPKFLVQVTLNVISQIAGVMSIYLPNAETAYANAIAEAEAEMAELQDLMEQIDIERVQMLEDFLVKAESRKSESYETYLTYISEEAEVLGVSPEQLSAIASDYYVSVGLLESYSLAQNSVVTEANLLLTEYEQYIDSLQVVNSNEEFLEKIEEYTGYNGDTDTIVAGKLQVSFVDLIHQYDIAIEEYVEQELLEQFSSDIDQANASISYDTVSYVRNELALINESDDSSYTEKLNNELAAKKEEQEQEAQKAADSKEDNAQLSDKLNNECASYQAEAETVAQVIADQASLHVKETLESSAREKLETVFSDILQEISDAASKELTEVNCPGSRDKVYAWESELKRQIENLLNGGDIVSTQSDAASNNQDRKASLEALVTQTTQVWTARVLELSGVLDNVSDQEDPEDCGLPTDPSDKKIDFSGAEKITSPLVVDLDGDGVETLAKTEYIYFDHDGNGVAERTGWVASDDGILVMDKNGDGQISSGNELFGSNTQLANGDAAANGFVALSQYDDNSDSVIDHLDAAYSTINVWQDLDSDGKVDEGEILSLADAGISSLSTSWVNTSVLDGKGNVIKQTSTATTVDGSSVALSDVWFGTDAGHSITVEKLELSEEIQALPEAKGFGNLHNLSQAMARDEVLQSLVQQFVDAPDDTSRRAMLNGIIFQWAGVSDIDPYSRDPSRIYGHVIDARKLETLEALAGRNYLGTWCWGERDPNPHGRAAPVLNSQYEEFKGFIYAQLMAGSAFKEVFDLIEVEFNMDTLEFFQEMGAFTDYLVGLAESGEVVALSRVYGVLVGLGEFYPQMSKAAAQLKSNATLAPLIAENLVEGTVGDDILSGTSAGDLLVGGIGNDVLYGKKGNDVYLFNRGDGSDRIYDSSGSDSITFGVDISSEMLSYSRNATSLFITVLDAEGNPSSDSIQIDNVFDFDGSVSEGAIEAFSFSDGSTLTMVDIIPLIDQEVTEGDDTLYGTELDDTFNALQGNDTVYGGAGNDLYQFSIGDGQDVIYENAGTDTIEFLGGIQATQVKIERTGTEGEDLLVHLYDVDGNATGDTIRVVKAYQSYAASGNRIEQVRFTLEDGTLQTLALDELEKLYNVTELDDVVYGFESDDTISALNGIDTVHGAGGSDTLHGDEDDDLLYGEAGDDILIGGSGNDVLNGGSGNDTYLFASGDGHDIIDNRDRGSVDVLEFDSSVNPSKVRLMRVDNDLFISIDRNTDSIQVKSFFNGDAVSSTALDEIRFADGSVLTLQDVIDLTLEATMGADFIQGYSSDDTIAARGGDDIVYGGRGDDMVSGDQGKDLLFGENGNDMLFGQQGVDQLYGGQGDDILYGGNEEDQLYGSSGKDVLHGENDSDTLFGGGQDDTLYGGNGADLLMGEFGNDMLHGDAGDDILAGGGGDDVLAGGLGNDTFNYTEGDGNDQIEAGKKESSGYDTLSLSGFDTDQIWLRQQGDDLLVSFVGSNGQVTIDDWQTYDDAIDEIDVGDFSACGEDIERLVSAMAAFDAPSGVGEVIPQDVKDQLRPVLAASWHANSPA